ncbi:hypothetical protein E3N88_39970 [Mikania micrantha]|uniref:Integrase catalytic domain-containing protein n=1 Tax=Mikania micrantha TaxID=192012 RepID=A0A5N6LLA2_9ASTR|nr:hypothetical protein E3N88_39970 [Mikania micrantha]
MAERQFNTKLKNVQTDWGGEFRNLAPFFSSLGIIHRRSCPHTSEQNGIVERRHRHVVETGLALLAHSNTPSRFWNFAFDTAVYLINRMPSKTLSNKSPFEHLFKRPPNYSFLRVFGCQCFPYLRPYNRHKMDFRSTPCVFLGYSPLHHGYRCLDLDTDRVYIARHVRFNEHLFPFLPTNSLNFTPLTDPYFSSFPTSFPPSSSADPTDQPSSPPLQTQQSPLTTQQPISPTSTAQSPTSQPTPDLNPPIQPTNQPRTRPPNLRPKPQPPSPKEGWIMHHLDVKLAFLNGELIEEVYVSQPKGFIVKGKENKVYRLKKSLYGLRQAPRAWNARHDKEPADGTTLKQSGYAQKISKEAGLKNSNSTLWPMDPKLQLAKDDAGECVDATMYRRLIGSRRYLLHTRPDLGYSTGVPRRKNVRIRGTDPNTVPIGGNEDPNQSLKTGSINSIVVGNHDRRPVNIIGMILVPQFLFIVLLIKLARVDFARVPTQRFEFRVSSGSKEARNVPFLVNAIIDMIQKEDFNTIFDHAIVNNDDVLEDEIEDDIESYMDDELEEDAFGDETQTGSDETQVPSTYTNLEETNLNIDDNWIRPYNERETDIIRELGKDSFKDKDEFTRAVKLYNIRYCLRHFINNFNDKFSPLPHEAYWPNSSSIRELIPNSDQKRDKRGRPRSTRLRNGMDIKEGKKTNHCGICGNRGHNRATCLLKPKKANV